MIIDISLINSFVYGINKKPNIFNVKSPVCAECHQKSNWLASFYSSMLVIGGLSVKMSFCFPSIIVISESILAVYLLAEKFTNSVVLAVISAFLFFNASGVGWFSWFWLQSRLTAHADYVFYHSTNGHSSWMHPILHYLMENRSSQFVVAISAALIYFLDVKYTRNIMILYGVLIGLLPVLQYQAFLSISLFLILYFIISLIPNFHVNIFNMAWLLNTFTVVGFVPLLNLRTMENDFNNIRFEKTWYDYINEGYFYPFIAQWGLNLGIFWVIANIFVWFIATKSELNLLIPSSIIWLIGNFINFTDHPVHNTPYFMATWVLLSSIFIIKLFDRMLSKIKNEETRGIVLAFCMILVISMTWSSVLGVIKSTRNDLELFNENMKQVSDYLIKNANPSEVILAPPSDQNPMLVYCGYQSLRMNDMFMYLTGYKWKVHQEEANYLYANPLSDVLANVKYSLEHKRYNWGHLNKSQDISQRWTVVMENDLYILYKRK